MIGETKINLFARALFLLLAFALLGVAASLVYNLWKSKVLIIHRKGADFIKISKFDTGDKRHDEVKRVYPIKTVEERSLLSVLVGYSTTLIFSILIVYFCANDLLSIIISVFFLPKVVYIFFIALEHVKRKPINDTSIYKGFVSLYIILSVGYNEYHTSCMKQGNPKLKDETKTKCIELQLGDMVSGKSGDLFYVSTEPNNYHTR